MKRSIKPTALLLCATFCAVPARSEETAERPTQEYEEPDGRVVKVDGRDHVCFNLDEHKAIGHIFTDYHLLFAVAESMERERELWKREAELSNKRAELWKVQAEWSLKEYEFVLKLLNEERGYRLRVGKQARFKEWLLLTILVAETIAVGVIGVVSAAQR